MLITLDENTDSKRKKAMTWDAIFKKVELFVELDLESIAELQASNVQKRQQVILYKTTLYLQLSRRCRMAFMIEIC